MADTTVYATAFIIVDREEDGAAYLRKGPNVQRTHLTIDEAVARYGWERVAAEIHKLAHTVEYKGSRR